MATKAVKDGFFCAIGSETVSLSDEELQLQLKNFLEFVGERDDVLLIPPDFTRFHSKAGTLTRIICEHYNFIPRADNDPAAAMSHKVPNVDILPALGTHAPMTKDEISKMFGPHIASMDPSPVLIHDWRNDVITIGHSPAEMVRTATRGMVNEPWPVQVNKIVWDRRLKNPETQHRPFKSLVLSIGQVVPHEVMGMANYNKNLFIGTGGVEAINLSHFIGAVHGMERMMGKTSNPLRDILNHASQTYLEEELDLWYILTVVSPDPAKIGELCVRGLFIGRDIRCYLAACDLSLKVNFALLEKPVMRMVVLLDVEEFHSTWLGNKAIYRTRMAIADGGEIIILAPGVCRFGEDDTIDRLIRKYGYCGTPAVMKSMKENRELRENLSAVAHLIHGSSEGRFTVTYCPGGLTRQEVEQVGFQYGDLQAMYEHYDLLTLEDGWNSNCDGEFFFIRNPALGLWAFQPR
ncbi:hypothetical protein MPSEU_000365400 [Mayamaea pseudoterrestris]|nr:hypothetical protein MPSEU_000365400 [Mayamaea pseudoterrestris]